jgi:hypothetical protein
MCNNVFIYLPSNLNLYLPIVHCHGWSFPCCTWPLNFWYTAIQIINYINYSVTFVSSKQVLDLKKQCLFVNEFVNIHYVLSLSCIYLTVFLYCLSSLFIRTFHKHWYLKVTKLWGWKNYIGYNEISVIIKTLQIQNDSCEH